jgi:RND family efflux transporter MFP subunit
MPGVVLERLVTPGTAVTTGTPLFVVSNLTSLWANIEIDESLLSHVGVSMPMQLRVAAYPGQTFDGRVELVGDTVNPKTRRVTVRCAMTNADGRLKPEMYATAVIRASAPHESIVVPRDAIQSVDGQHVVFVAETTDRFRPQPVTPGSDIGGMVEIRSGLASGTRIAMTGAFVLKSELLKSTAPAED